MSGSDFHKIRNSQTFNSKRIYAGRVAGGDRDYWDLDRNDHARGPIDSRVGAARLLPESAPANWISDHPVSRYF